MKHKRLLHIVSKSLRSGFEAVRNGVIGGVQGGLSQQDSVLLRISRGNPQRGFFERDGVTHIVNFEKRIFTGLTGPVKRNGSPIKTLLEQ